MKVSGSAGRRLRTRNSSRQRRRDREGGTRPSSGSGAEVPQLQKGCTWRQPGGWQAMAAASCVNSQAAPSATAAPHLGEAGAAGRCRGQLPLQGLHQRAQQHVDGVLQGAGQGRDKAGGTTRTDESLARPLLSACQAQRCPSQAPPLPIHPPASTAIHMWVPGTPTFMHACIGQTQTHAQTHVITQPHRSTAPPDLPRPRRCRARWPLRPQKKAWNPAERRPRGEWRCGAAAAAAAQTAAPSEAWRGQAGQCGRVSNVFWRRGAAAGPKAAGPEVLGVRLARWHDKARHGVAELGTAQHSTGTKQDVGRSGTAAVPEHGVGVHEEAALLHRARLLALPAVLACRRKGRVGPGCAPSTHPSAVLPTPYLAQPAARPPPPA